MRLSNLFERATRESVLDKLRAMAHDPNAYISFSHVEKLGINPQSEWNDPFGVYAYPVAELLPDLEQGIFPWAAERPHAYLLRATGNIVDLSTYTVEELDRDLDAMVAKFRPLLMQPRADGDSSEEIFYSLMQGWRDRWVTNGSPGQALWLITGRMASRMERDNPGRDIRMLWNSLFRSVGIDGVVDRGQSIISTNEPSQVAFFSVRAYSVLEMVYNDLVPQRAIQESVSAEQLEKLARDIMEVNDDMFSDEWDSHRMSEADCLKVIEFAFHSANCDEFAQVCEEITGDQAYTIRYANKHHTVLSLSDYDGPFYDVTGMITLDEICRRYKFPRDKVEITEGCYHYWMDEDDSRETIRDVLRYLKLIGRKPFTEFPLD